MAVATGGTDTGGGFGGGYSGLGGESGGFAGASRSEEHVGGGGYGTDTGGTGLGGGDLGLGGGGELGGISGGFPGASRSEEHLEESTGTASFSSFGSSEAAAQFLGAPNPVTPSFSNAQVIGFGQTPTGRFLGRLGLGLAGLTMGGLAAAPGYLGSNFAVSGPGSGGQGPEGGLGGAATGTGTVTATTTSGTPTATTSDPLAALSGAVSSLFGGGPGGGGGGGAQLPERGLTYIPTTKTGSTLGLLLALAGLGGVGYWVYRRSKERH